MRSHKRLMVLLALLFVVVYPLILGLELRTAERATNGLVITQGDNQEYQRLAVNLAFGLGFTNDIRLPWSAYHLSTNTRFGQRLAQEYAINGEFNEPPESEFYRAPGLPMLLAGAYRLFGNTPLVARTMLAVVVWLTAAALLALGWVWGRQRGLWAGMIVGLVYVLLPERLRSWSVEPLLTELPAALWATLCGLALALYWRDQRDRYLFLGVLAFLALVWTRSNFIIAFPFLILLIAWRARSILKVAALCALVALPILVWSAYASRNVGRFVSFTTQGEIAFPQFNNIDVLEGVGSQQAGRGGWNPGWIYNAAGDRIIAADWRHRRQPGMNGYVQGLTFWAENLTRLPELFYWKLNANFWSSDRLAPFYAFSLGLLITAVRPPRWLIRRRWTARQKLRVQLPLLLMLLLVEALLGDSSYWLVLISYAALGLTLLAGDPNTDRALPFPPSAWLLAFAAGHFITTLLFGDYRFDDPLSPMLLLYGMLGMFTLATDGRQLLRGQSITAAT